ncbi:unnamed protein product [Sphagnum balticum]
MEYSLTCAQPWQDPTSLARQLIANHVALESVAVVNDTDIYGRRLTGTVLTKNVACEKRVFIRFTTINWASYFDRPCTHIQTLSTHEKFVFDIRIPLNARTKFIEFCVYCILDTEYGSSIYCDDNMGRSYRLTNDGYLSAAAHKTNTLLASRY